MRRIRLLLSFVVLSLMFCVQSAYSQVTTSSINGSVVDQKGEALPGAIIIAVHLPSGSKYGTSTRSDGKYNIVGMRVGGPYKVSVSYVGYETQVKENVFLNLGLSTTIEFKLLDQNIETKEISVTAQRGAVFSSDRTGAATSVGKEALDNLPTISRRLGDFTRLTPQASGNSFAGQDTRLNNITVDGAYFNNSFGLGPGTPGDRTGVAPISLDAIEQIQVNIAPFDVRQGNFVGAGVNTVTKSGTNRFTGSAYYQFRDESMVGTKALDQTYNPGTFRYKDIGFFLGGPIIQNKLFFFGSFEDDSQTKPATTFLANTGGQTVGGNITRVLASDLDKLSSYLKSSFGYETGPYQGYDFQIPSTRLLLKLDYNLDDKNKLTLRYTQLDSKSDQIESSSTSLGVAGSRNFNNTAMSFQASNYKIMENIKSVVGEWNSILSDKMSNNLIVGYSYNDESREYAGKFFPFVEILNNTTTYTSFGFEPFTPNNELRYHSLQLQNNFSIYGVDHNLTFGVSMEKYRSENVFFPGAQSAYTYNSLDDFYTDANDFLQNPNRTVSPVTLRRFQVRYSNIPGQVKPIQPLDVFYTGAYAQDEWQVTPKIKLTLGLRLDIPFFGDNGYKNAEANAMNFRDANGNTVQYQTEKLPGANLLWSPRFGFNWDVFGDQTTQVRGGSGVFTARPAYVWISNQIGNTGVLTGFDQIDNTKARPFNPNPDAYKPTNVTGAPAASYELALTDPNFKFPQIWRNNIAVDQKLPYDIIATAEYMYNKDVNGMDYINANLPAAQTKFTGVDNRLRWTSNKINSKVANAVVLQNQNVGLSWNFAFSLEKPFSNGFFAKVAYSYGETKNTVDPGSIASGSWNSNQMSNDPNNPGLGYSANSSGHRVFALVSYKANYFDFGSTSLSLFWEGRTLGNISFTYSGDLNGDGNATNDLIYIPKDISEMNFEEYSVTVSGVTRKFTVQDQATAFENYIQKDSYLNSHRGEYAVRGAAFLPMVFRMDLGLVQEVYADLLGARNSLQFRVDILNFGNLLNKNWGVGQRYSTVSGINVQPLVARGADAQGRALYRMKNVGTDLLSKTFEQSLSAEDVYRIQLSIRYMFN